MIKRLLIAAMLVMACATPVFARARFWGYAERGGQSVVVAGFSSSTKVQRSYPGATISVYSPGTTTLVTIYSTEGGAAKANPFTADSAGFYEFFGDSGAYDVRFSGTGILTPFTINLTGVSTEGDIFVADYGAACNGTTDDTAAIQAALSVVGAHKVRLPAGACKFTTQLTINQNGVGLEGAGNRASALLFVPASSGLIGIKIVNSNAAQVAYYNFLRNFRIYSTETSLQKTAIQLNDVSAAEITNVEVGPSGLWNGTTGGTSIGLHIKGRELIDLKKFTCYTDGNPIRASVNPNSASLDFDVVHFEDIYTGVVGTNNYHILFDDGVDVTSWTMDGANVFVLGGGGVYKNDTTSPFFNYSINVSGLRWEQANNTGGWLWWWRENTRIRGMNLENLVTGNAQTQKGIHIENTESTTISNFDYQGFGGVNAVMLETAGYNDYLTILSSPSLQDSYKTMTNMTQVFGFGRKPASNVAMQAMEFWTSTSNTSRNSAATLWGIHTLRGTGSLNNGANVALLDMANFGVTHAFVRVASTGATTVEGGDAIAFGTITVTATGASANFQTTPAGGKLSVSYSAPNLILTNNLGESVSYTYTIEWR